MDAAEGKKALRDIIIVYHRWSYEVNHQTTWKIVNKSSSKQLKIIIRSSDDEYPTNAINHIASRQQGDQVMLVK